MSTIQRNFIMIDETIGGMDPEEFRKYGKEIIDWIADYLKNTEKYPVMSQVKYLP